MTSQDGGAGEYGASGWIKKKKKDKEMTRKGLNLAKVILAEKSYVRHRAHELEIPDTEKR